MDANVEAYSLAEDSGRGLQAVALKPTLLANGPHKACLSPFATYTPVPHTTTGGRAIAVREHQIQLRKIAENCSAVTKSPEASRRISGLQQAALNITMKLKHEPKAADVVIQFVLPLGNSATLRGGGGTRTGPDATPPPQLSAKTCGGAGGSAGGWTGGGLAARPGGGGLRATYYYHMHTSRGGLCLGAWGYRGMYAIIAISHLCQEESLKGLKDQRHSTPFN